MIMWLYQYIKELQNKIFIVSYNDYYGHSFIIKFQRKNFDSLCLYLIIQNNKDWSKFEVSSLEINVRTEWKLGMLSEAFQMPIWLFWKT